MPLSGILAEKAREEHEVRQRSDGHVRGARLDSAADLGVRVEEEKFRYIINTVIQCQFAFKLTTL